VNETEQLQMRVHWPAAEPTLVYLPGLHGDWTLIGGFRRALNGRVRFVETTYPRTLTWSLEDYAAAVEEELNRLGIAGAWLLGESFSSQIVWPLLQRKRLNWQGVVLAGGFVRHPISWGVRLAERVTSGVSLTFITKILFGYARLARMRFRRAPEVATNINEFIARRTELDRQAAVHRLRLILQTDWCAVAREAGVPIYAITGAFDPIVPWIAVRHWLRRHCRALRVYRIIWTADHNVLGTAPQKAADQVLEWMKPSPPSS
jgi:pimeloyl-ACP methyl ester carboxylesterase